MRASPSTGYVARRIPRLARRHYPRVGTRAWRDKLGTIASALESRGAAHETNLNFLGDFHAHRGVRVRLWRERRQYLWRREGPLRCAVSRRVRDGPELAIQNHRQRPV